MMEAVIDHKNNVWQDRVVFAGYIIVLASPIYAYFLPGAPGYQFNLIKHPVLYLCSLAILTYSFAVPQYRKWILQSLSLKCSSLKTVAFVGGKVAVWSVIGYYGIAGVQDFIDVFYPPISVGPTAYDQYAMPLSEFPYYWLEMTLGTFLIVFIQEISFRCILYQVALRLPYGVISAIICTSALFGLWHYWSGFERILETALGGSVYAVQTIYSRSLWPAILTHFYINASIMSYYSI
ncbi:MAG: CPBP family intramembrane metalloprotease [Rhodospirillales bacterium]|jgi:membrane protease YdiL (CAAX protease family)|nr:CPBP family intramembrane metalloprotease [Rhodospirillales bacterium]